jgi:hypothetical protein
MDRENLCGEVVEDESEHGNLQKVRRSYDLRRSIGDDRRLWLPWQPARDRQVLEITRNFPMFRYVLIEFLEEMTTAPPVKYKKTQDVSTQTP